MAEVGKELAAANPTLVSKAVKAAVPSPEAAFNIIAKQVMTSGAEIVGASGSV